MKNNIPGIKAITHSTPMTITPVDKKTHQKGKTNSHKVPNFISTTKIPAPTEQKKEIQRKEYKDRSITLKTEKPSISIPQHLESSVKNIEESFDTLMKELNSEKSDTIYAIHYLTNNFHRSLSKKEKISPALKPLIDEYRDKANTAIQEKRALLCAYKVLVEAGLITANKEKDYSSFTYDPNDTNSVITALRRMVPRLKTVELEDGTKETKPVYTKHSLVKPDKLGDVTFYKDEFEHNKPFSKRRLALFGLTLDQNNHLSMMKADGVQNNSWPVTQNKAFKAAKSLLDNNHPRNDPGRKYPFKVSDYELLFKTFDDIYKKKQSHEDSGLSEQSDGSERSPIHTPYPVQITKAELESGVKAVLAVHKELRVVADIPEEYPGDEAGYGSTEHMDLPESEEKLEITNFEEVTETGDPVDLAVAISSVIPQHEWPVATVNEIQTEDAIAQYTTTQPDQLNIESSATAGNPDKVFAQTDGSETEAIMAQVISCNSEELMSEFKVTQEDCRKMDSLKDKLLKSRT